MVLIEMNELNFSDVLGRFRKSGGPKIDIISLLLNKFPLKFAHLNLLSI